MGKQYIFFRDPTGKPHKKGDGQHAPKNLLAQLGKASSIGADGQVEWKGLGLQLFGAIDSSFAVLDHRDVELNQHDSGGIFWKAIAEVLRLAPGKPIEPSELVRAANPLAAAFYRHPMQKYVLVSSLSVARLPCRRIAVKDCSVSPLRKRLPRFPLPKVLQSLAHRAAFSQHRTSTKYQLVKVMAEGRSIYEGAENALNALNLLRAIWSLAATMGQWSMRFAGPMRKPIGVIHTGPFHTLHRPDGNAADENYYWYDPDYISDLELFDPSDRWPQIEKDRRWVMRRLARLPYRQDLKDLLLRYIGALDQPNPNISFLQMWGILEKITNTVGAQYDETIKRVTRVYNNADRPLVKDLLATIRHRRNQYVHSGKSNQESTEAAFLVKSFADPHLRRLIQNRLGFQNLQEYGEHLALSTDLKTLEKMQRWSSQALREERQEESV